MLIFQNLAISFVPDKSIYNPIFKQSPLSSLSVWIVTSIKKYTRYQAAWIMKPNHIALTSNIIIKRIFIYFSSSS